MHRLCIGFSHRGGLYLGMGTTATAFRSVPLGEISFPTSWSVVTSFRIGWLRVTRTITSQIFLAYRTIRGLRLRERILVVPPLLELCLSPFLVLGRHH